jgi:hypothetical protein
LHHQLRIAALLIALTLVPAACAASPDSSQAVTGIASPTAPEEPATTTTDSAPSPTTSTSTTTTTTLPLGVQSPLNGLYVLDETSIDRRVIAVKIDNHAEARPQSGVEQADAMIELMAEGVTRFIALSLQTDIDYLGPNRSVRPTDPTLVKPLNATLVISGGQDWIKSIVASVGVPLNGEIPPASFRQSHRSAPHNLYVSTLLHRDLATRRNYSDEPMQQPWFEWGELQGTELASEVTLNWTPGLVVTWKYQEGRYVRYLGQNTQNWTDQTRQTIEPMAYDTLVVIMAEMFWQGSQSGSGSAVPVMTTTGSGVAQVFSDGHVTTGTWHRQTNDEPFTLRTDSGEDMLVPPGQLWVNIFPRDRSVSWS